MSKIFSKENFNTVVLSLISSVIFLLVFEPIIHIGKDLASKGFQAFADYFFFSCSYMSADRFLATVACNFTCLLLSSCFCYFFISRMESTRKNSSKTQKTQDIIQKIPDIIFVVMCIFLTLDTVVFKYIPVLQRDDFDRWIIQITPYVEAKEIDLLKSNWASMQTESDYRLIYNEIYNILEENNLS